MQQFQDFTLQKSIKIFFFQQFHFKALKLMRFFFKNSPEKPLFSNADAFSLQLNFSSLKHSHASNINIYSAHTQSVLFAHEAFFLLKIAKFHHFQLPGRAFNFFFSLFRSIHRNECAIVIE